MSGVIGVVDLIPRVVSLFFGALLARKEYEKERGSSDRIGSSFLRSLA